MRSLLRAAGILTAVGAACYTVSGNDSADSSRISTPRVIILGSGDSVQTARARRLAHHALETAGSPRDIMRNLRDLEQLAALTTVGIDSAAGRIQSLTLKQLPILRKIRVTGQYPLFESDIYDAMTLHTGSPLTASAVDSQKSLIEELYRKQGFLSPRVETRIIRPSNSPGSNRDGRPEYRDLAVEISNDTFLRLHSLEMEGVNAFSPFRIRVLMNTWKSSLFPGSAGRYVDHVLREDLETLRRFFDEQHFHASRIEASVDTNPTFPTVRITLHVTEGPRYDVDFQGNDNLPDRVLRKHLDVTATPGISGAPPRVNLGKLRSVYRRKGYHAAAITVTDTPPPPDSGALPVHKVTIAIDEGIRTTVGKLSISGAEHISPSRVRGEMRIDNAFIFREPPFVPEILEADLAAVRTLYANEGFTRTAVKAESEWGSDSSRVDIRIDITEGPRTIIDSLVFTNLTIMPEARARKVLSMREGDPFRAYTLRTEENALAAEIAERGYPHVKVVGGLRWSPDSSSVTIMYEILQGPAVTVADIFVTGNFKTRESALQRRFGLDPPCPFRLGRILKGQRKLRDADVFNSVSFSPLGLQRRDDTVALVLQLEEKKPYYAGGAVAFESEKGLAARVGGGDHNFLGRFKDLSGAVQVYRQPKTPLRLLGIDGNIAYTDPAFFTTDFVFTLDLSAERRIEPNLNFGVHRFSLAGGVKRDLRADLSTQFSSSYEQRNLFRINPDLPIDTTDADVERLRDLITFNPSITADTRNSFVRPTRGALSTFAVEVLTGLRNDLDNLVRFRLDATAYASVLPRTGMAFMNRLGYAFSYAEDPSLPRDRLFFLGGTGSVRGYAENMLYSERDERRDELVPAGGQAMVSASLELRIDLGFNLELPLFFDTGRLGVKLLSTDLSGFRSSVGTGLRYLTPIGPVGLVYGYKLRRRKGESSGRIHFSVGYTM